MSFNALSLAKLGVGFGALAVASVGLLSPGAADAYETGAFSAQGTSSVEAVGQSVATGYGVSAGVGVVSGASHTIFAGVYSAQGFSAVEATGSYLLSSGSYGLSQGSSTSSGVGGSTAETSGSSTASTSAQAAGAWFQPSVFLSEAFSAIAAHGGVVIPSQGSISAAATPLAYSLRVLPSQAGSAGLGQAQSTGASYAGGHALSSGSSTGSAAASPIATGAYSAAGAAYADAFAISTTYAPAVYTSTGAASLFGRGSWKTTAYEGVPFFALLVERYAYAVERGSDAEIADDAVDVATVFQTTTPLYVQSASEVLTVTQLTKHTSLLSSSQSSTICQTTLRPVYVTDQERPDHIAGKNIFLPVKVGN